MASRIARSTRLVVCVFLILGACDRPASGPSSIRLGDLVGALVVERASSAASDEVLPSAEWRFELDSPSGVPSGVGWHGLWDIYRETIVTRPSEKLSFDLILPERPWLDLAVGTLHDGAATFRVEVEDPGSMKKPRVLMERTVSLANRWVPAPVDLHDFAGRHVTLSLALEANRPDSTGFWGTAAIRNRNEWTAVVERPHGVIVIVADTLRSDHLSPWGYERETTPFFSEVARQGVVFRDCIAQATWTKVSVPSIVTSLFPSSHGVVELEDRLPSSATTLSEVFREAGYATLAYTSIPLVGRFTNLQQGYEELHEQGSLRYSSNSKTAREYVDRLLPWLEAHRDTPFFVFLHVSDPHGPYLAYEPYDTRWGAPEDAAMYADLRSRVQTFIRDPILSQVSMARREELNEAGIDPEEFVDYEIDAYDGSILAMDVELRRLFEQLRALRLEDRTLVVFTSDHGTEFLDHGGHFHGHTTFGELNRVPLIFWGPSFVPSGRVVEQTIRSIDVMPTILELAGLSVPDEAQGQSLLPLFDPGGSPSIHQPVITEKPSMLGKHSVVERGYESVAIIDGKWKLIRNQPTPDHREPFELFDHAADPLNLFNVAAHHPETVRRLASALEQWQSNALAAGLAKDGEAGAELDANDRERLESLGYLPR